MVSQPQNAEFRNNLDNFHPCLGDLEISRSPKTTGILHLKWNTVFRF